MNTDEELLATGRYAKAKKAAHAATDARKHALGKLKIWIDAGILPTGPVIMAIDEARLLLADASHANDALEAAIIAMNSNAVLAGELPVALRGPLVLGRSFA